MPKTIKQKTHTFLLTVRTNKPCTKRHALREARQCIHGKHFTAVLDDDDPDTLRVVSIQPTDRRS